MKHEAAYSDEEVPEIRDAEDGVVAVGLARLDSAVGEVDEHQVGEGIDDLGGIVG